MAAVDDDQQFCLRWNNHQSTLISVFDTLLEKGIHVDCTLAAEGRTLNAHKVVLSACSPYFEAVLSQQYDKHPIIILKDVKFAELRAMMDYMYRGEVNISQDQLGALLKAAESLQIKGLSDNKPASSTPPAPSPPSNKIPSARGSPVEDDESGDGSASPRRRRKRHRPSLSPVAETPGTIAPPATLTNCFNAQTDDAQKKIRDAIIDTPAILTKTENNGDSNAELKTEFGSEGNESVEDLTMDEVDEADSDGEQTGASSSNTAADGANSQGFNWQADRSQDDSLAGQEGQRDSQDKACFSESPLWIKEEKNTETKVERTDFADSQSIKIRRTDGYPKIARADGLTLNDATDNFNVMNAKIKTLPCAQYATAKGFTCPNCQRTYNARKNLVRHINLECGREPQYKCPYCPHRNHRRNELKRHIDKKHLPEPPLP